MGAVFPAPIPDFYSAGSRQPSYLLFQIFLYVFDIAEHGSCCMVGA